MRGLMRGVLKKLKVFSLYRKLVLSFLAISVVFVSFISGMLYLVFDHSFQRELEHLSESALVKADSMLTQTYENLFPFVHDVLVLSTIDSSLYGQQVNRLHEFQTLHKLRGMQTAYQQIFGITLINFQNDRFLGTRGVGFGYDPAIKTAMQGSSDRGMYTLRRQIRRNENISSSPLVNVISFVYQPSGLYAGGVIVIDVEEAYLENLIHYGTGTEMDRTFILSLDGQFVTSEDEVAQLGIDWKTVLASDAGTQSRRLEHGDVTYLVHAMPARIPGWQIVRMMPYDQISPFGANFWPRLLAIIILLVFVDLIISAMLIGRLYNPVKSLLGTVVNGGGEPNPMVKREVDEIKLVYAAMRENVRKIERLEAYQDRSSTLLGDRWVKALLRGDADEVREVMRLTELDLSEYKDKHLAVVVIAVDGYSQYLKRYDAQERGLHGFAMSNICEELLTPYLAGGLVRVETETIAALLAFDQPTVPEDIMRALYEFQGYMAKYFGLSITLSIGPTCTEWEDVGAAYRQARIGVQQRFYTGPGSIIDASQPEIQVPEPMYPYKLQAMLSEAVLLQNERRIETALSRFISAIRAYGIPYIRSYTERCIHDIRHDLARKGIILPADEELHSAIGDAETLASLEILLRDRLEKMLQDANEASEREREIDHPVAHAKAYIDEHYDDPNLSVEFLAGLVGLTPSYFGKLFTNALSIPCGNYIVDVRMEKAAAMLLETDMTARSISEAVGLNSTNYFYLLFKKKYGVTPIQYRKQHNHRA